MGIPGHANCRANHIADQFTKRVVGLDDRFIDPFVGFPVACCKSFIKRESYKIANLSAS